MSADGAADGEVEGTNVTGAGWGLTPEQQQQLRAEAALVVARYPQSRSALLPLLHLVQSYEGFVSPDGIEFCARVLGLTTAEVSAVATFYTMYKRRPVGDYHVGVCTNTLCAIMGGDAIFEALKDHLDVGNDERTDDGSITLEHIECNAACDYAPVMMVNWEFFDNQTIESAKDLVDQLRTGASVMPTRGARLCTFKETEHLLAGFYDGRANEGPSAGPPSLAGLRLAQQRDRDGQTGTDTKTGSDTDTKTDTTPAGAPADRPGSGIATGYGTEGGPSGDDAGVHTAKSDPASATAPGEQGEAVGPQGIPKGSTDTTQDRPTNRTDESPSRGQQ